MTITMPTGIIKRIEGKDLFELTVIYANGYTVREARAFESVAAAKEALFDLRAEYRDAYLEMEMEAKAEREAERYWEEGRGAAAFGYQDDNMARW